MFFESDSDSEVELFNLKIVRRRLRDESNPMSLPKKAFQQQFRLSKDAFKYILDELQMPFTTQGSSVPPCLKLAATLNLLATGSYQLSIGSNYLIGMAQSTVSKMLKIVINEMQAKLCTQWIKIDPERFGDSKSFFYERFRIPGVIGCVDGSHVFILKPAINEHMYFNRKGTHSVNVMIISDHANRIISVNSSYGGAAHDSFVWSLTNEKSFLENRFNDGDRNSFLLGDSGYALAPWLITPYRAAQDDSPESLFNQVHSKARSTVERTLGIWKGRWRCLQDERKMRYSPQFASKIINVTAALHNICKHFNVELDTTEIYRRPRDLVLQTEAEDVTGNYLNIASRIRNEIRNSLLN